MTKPQIEDRSTEYHTREIERHAAIIRGDGDLPFHPDDYHIPSGRALRIMRETCGISMEDVADRADVTYSHLSKVERDDSRPSARLLVTLLRLYRHEWPAEVDHGER